ncbi:hypothetical protein [Streptomyces sp. SYP-A7185]|uniref:hypothetical protein n=1 Tax=Streptomyces sp. SYP-A7185 TaxID=3040076 RepID=UPI0038F66DCA
MDPSRQDRPGDRRGHGDHPGDQRGHGDRSGHRPGHGVSFSPTRPASHARKVTALLLGTLVWIAAGALAVVLLGHSYILRHLLLAVLISWIVFGAVLACCVAMRHREERRELP